MTDDTGDDADRETGVSDPLDWPPSRDESVDHSGSDDGGGFDDGADGDIAGDESTADGTDDRSLDDPADAPLGDLASSVRDRRDREPVDEGLFEEHDVTPIDSDAVWDRLESEETAEPDAAAAGLEERVVEKDSYCEGCPYFSSPPDVSCTHEGTSILELVDVDHFRVADCPKVEETERLEQL